MTLLSRMHHGWPRPIAYFSDMTSVSQAFVAIASIIVIYYARLLYIRYVYNVYFHPLARFPGPKAAALSRRWVWNVQNTGLAEQTYEALHKEHGAHAIRIAPNELHIDDVHLYKTTYSQSNPYLKEEDFYDAFAGPHTVFIEADPVRHKIRRKALNSFFSKQGIVKLQPIFVDKIQKLCSRLRQLEKKGQVFNADNGFRCLTVDIISTTTSGKAADLLQTSDGNFNNDYLKAFNALSDIIWDLVYQPLLRKTLRKIPASIATRVSSTAVKMRPLVDHSVQALAAFKREQKEGDSSLIYSVLCTLPRQKAAEGNTYPQLTLSRR